MYETFGHDLWWLIPLVMIGLCVFWGRGCCFGRRHHHSHRSGEKQDAAAGSALQILDRRYACGEIDHDDYQRMKNNISEKREESQDDD